MTPKQLYLHTSNRIENLARRLVEVASEQPLGSALAQETVMTLNPGMARWLRFEIARQTGVSFGWDSLCLPSSSAASWRDWSRTSSDTAPYRRTKRAGA